MLIRQWLQGFAYHGGLSPGIFLLAGGGALLFALTAVSWHALRAAQTDPAEAIRNE